MTRGGFIYLGHRVTRAGARATDDILRRMQGRVTEVVLRGDVERIERSVASYRGLIELGRSW
ncbi:MAG: hypothetical protein GY719_27205 [bacterium]|nr:hypothetical protein [bacterium]